MTRYYASYFDYGLRKTPVIVIEEVLGYNEQFEGLIPKLYLNILQFCQYKVENNNIIIYNTTKNNKPEYSFAVKNSYQPCGPIVLELQLYVKNGEFEIKEKYFLNTVLYEDKLPKEVVINLRPVFGIKDDSGKELTLNAS